MIDKLGVGYVRGLDSAGVDQNLQTKAPQVNNGSGQTRASSELSGAITHMVQQGVPIDLERIAMVRDAIAAGEYPVDWVRIADNILSLDCPSHKSA